MSANTLIPTKSLVRTKSLLPKDWLQEDLLQKDLSQHSPTIRPILITTGEPAGIGMDIVLDVLLNQKTHQVIVMTACIHSLKERYHKLSCQCHYQKQPDFICLARFDDVNLPQILANYQYQISAQPATAQQDSVAILVIDTPATAKVQAGKANAVNASMVKNQLDIAHHLALSKLVSAVVTAPIGKSVMIDGNITLPTGEQFVGHTEYFMSHCRLDKVVMMLANAVMKVALVTTHIRLKDVCLAITAQALNKTIAIVYQSFIDGGINPKILVCGLNPHAGEGGHLGTEEEEIINPVLRQWQHRGVDISLALPADTIFTPKYLKACDVIIAMYHDQGLAPLKSHGFGDTVNITLGLPYVRTSVDHGTAFDLAGTGKALSGSLLCAIDMARQLSKQ